MHNISNVDIIPSYRSDHSTVLLSFQINEFKRVSGIWKFNNSLLKDNDYIKVVKKCIFDVREQNAVPVYNTQYIEDESDLQFTISDQLFLDVLLMEIRGKTISYSSYKKKQNILQEEKLQVEIKALEQDFNIDMLDILERKKIELQNLRKEKLEGVIIRSRTRWAEEGEKPTKYFCSLESRNFINKTIPKIELENGEIIYEQADILGEVKEYYHNLYNFQERDRNIDYDDIFNKLGDCPKLTEHEKNKLGEIKEQEIGQILKKMKNNKSQGSDGFTAEFFKFFYKDVKVSIRRAINESFKLGKFSISLRQGLIPCIPKGDKPRQFLKNWRPITLLNVIYKIASGCIAERLISVLTKLISSDQTGFISGRYIGENTRLIYDVMRYTEDENIPGILLIIDFEKAFDSISWEFITEVLDYFNFENSLKRWISVLYNDISSMVIQNGFLSESFPIKRGCRQGDPPSPYIFLLCAEVLSLLIKQNDYIKGIKIGELELKLSQYADDTTILLDGSEQSLEAALQTLSIFAKISGLKVNNSKTKAVWIGSKKFSGETFNHRFKLDWNQNNFEILGIIFSCNLDTMIQLNYVKKLKQIDRDLKQWSKRILTPFGRITVLKTLIISKLNHLFISLPNPSDDLINNLQKRFFSFVWNSKTDRIKRDVLIQEYNAGGLKMININNFVSALKISWIRRLITVDSKYKAIFELVYTKINNLLYRGMEFINELKMNRNNSTSDFSYKRLPL